MEKISKIYYEYDVKKKPLKTQRFETTHFHASFLWNGQNRFQFGTGRVMTILKKPKVVLPKPAPMNPRH
jgi:hypothetical protein